MLNFTQFVGLVVRNKDRGEHSFALKNPNVIYLDIVQTIEPTEEYQQSYKIKCLREIDYASEYKN